MCIEPPTTIPRSAYFWHLVFRGVLARSSPLLLIQYARNPATSVGQVASKHQTTYRPLVPPIRMFFSVFRCRTHDSHHKTCSRRKQYEPVRRARLWNSGPVASFGMAGHMNAPLSKHLKKTHHTAQRHTRSRFIPWVSHCKVNGGL